jgi:hypothetical protein
MGIAAGSQQQSAVPAVPAVPAGSEQALKTCRGIAAWLLLAVL